MTLGGTDSRIGVPQAQEAFVWFCDHTEGLLSLRDPDSRIQESGPPKQRPVVTDADGIDREAMLRESNGRTNAFFTAIDKRQQANGSAPGVIRHRYARQIQRPRFLLGFFR